MPKMIRATELKREYDADPRRCCENLTAAIDAGHLAPDCWSIREVAEAFLGSDVVHAMGTQKSGGMLFREAAGAVDTTAFSNITGQLAFMSVKKAFDVYDDVSDRLCTTEQTVFLGGEKTPGIGGVGDEYEVVDEGQTYPEVGMNEEYIETPALKKRGAIVSVTREIMIADRTGLLLKRCGEAGKYLGVNKLKRVMDAATGQTNTYKRNGTATNTYLTSGAYINKIASGAALVDWTDIEGAELLFDAMTDPNTGEPIVWGGEMTLLVPTALRRTAERIVAATQIRFHDGASQTTATYGANPLSSTPIAVVSTPYVKARTGSATSWFYGNYRDAFVYKQAWGIEADQAPDNSIASFERDIRQRFKFSEMGQVGVLEPRYVTNSIA
jgi:hypothetical protein